MASIFDREFVHRYCPLADTFLERAAHFVHVTIALVWCSIC